VWDSVSWQSGKVEQRLRAQTKRAEQSDYLFESVEASKSEAVGRSHVTSAQYYYNRINNTISVNHVIHSKITSPSHAHSTSVSHSSVIAHALQAAESSSEQHALEFSWLQVSELNGICQMFPSNSK
jgi:hypothetical protein